MNAYTLSIQIVCNMTLGSLTGSQTWARKDSFILVLRSVTFKTCLFNIYIRWKNPEKSHNSTKSNSIVRPHLRGHPFCARIVAFKEGWPLVRERKKYFC